MATHSSILAWRIPWTEEPGRLQSMGSELDMTEQLTVSLLPISQVSGLICSSKRSHLVSQSKEDSPP